MRYPLRSGPRRRASAGATETGQRSRPRSDEEALCCSFSVRDASAPSTAPLLSTTPTPCDDICSRLFTLSSCLPLPWHTLTTHYLSISPSPPSSTQSPRSVRCRGKLTPFRASYSFSPSRHPCACCKACRHAYEEQRRACFRVPVHLMPLPRLRPLLHRASSRSVRRRRVFLIPLSAPLPLLRRHAVALAEVHVVLLALIFYAFHDILFTLSRCRRASPGYPRRTRPICIPSFHPKSPFLFAAAPHDVVRLTSISTLTIC